MQKSNNSQTQAPKKERDWLIVIGVPLFLLLVSALITYMNNQAQLKITEQKQRDDVLNSYIQNMKELLLKKNTLLDFKKDDVSTTLARTFTITTLNQLNNSEEDTQGRNLRKGLVLRFLSESLLINNELPIVQFGGSTLESANFSGASLSGHNFSNEDLSHADLTGADLSGATLKFAKLNGTNLTGANLKDATLNGATLSGTILKGADLSGAKFLDAKLEDVDLSQAKSLTSKQLEGLEGENPPLLCKVELPEGFPDKDKFKRDCEKIHNPVPTPKSTDKQSEVKPPDPKAAKEISELKGHQGSVAFSPDGQTLATSGDDETICLWNTKGQLLKTFKCQGNQTANRGINSIDFSPDGQYLVSDAGGKIRLWDLKSANLVTEVVASQKRLRSVKFNPKPKNGQQLASTGDDGIIHLWNLQGQSLTEEPSTRPNWRSVDPISEVSELAFSPDGQQIASAEASGIVRLLNLQEKLSHQFIEHIPHSVLSVAFSPDGKQLVSSCETGMFRSWSLPDYEVKNRFDDVNGVGFYSVAYGLGGKLIVVGDNKGYIRMWKVNSQKQSLPFWTSPDQKSKIRKVAFSPDGKMFATAADDGIVKLWQLE
ncbi:hypothetical protein FD723_01910 [Nostoc sp. C052]|nr:hypothetical protein FD723_01910 [Nostoc sp. C052]